MQGASDVIGVYGIWDGCFFVRCKAHETSVDLFNLWWHFVVFLIFQNLKSKLYRPLVPIKCNSWFLANRHVPSWRNVEQRKCRKDNSLLFFLVSFKWTFTIKVQKYVKRHKVHRSFDFSRITFDVTDDGDMIRIYKWM